MATIYRSTHPTINHEENTSVPLFMSRSNPDSVPDDKIIHIDTIKDKTISYGGLRRDAALCASGLRSQLDLQVGDIVLCLVPNSTDLLLLAHSIWWAGATFSGLNPASTPKDIAHALSLVKPSHICVHPENLERTVEALQLNAQSPRILTIIERKDGHPLFPDDIIASKDPLTPFDPASHGLTARTALACINFSSGTTGPSKAVSLSHYGLIAAMRVYRASVPTVAHAGIREVFFAPYFHILGMTVVLLVSAWVGHLIVGMHKFDLDTYCRLIEKHRANRSYMVPPVAVAIANADLVAKYDLSSLERVIVGAAPVKRELQIMLKKRLGSSCRVIQAFGMTECIVTHHQTDADEGVAVGSIGKLLAGAEARIVNPNTRQDIAGSGEEGEMWLRSATVMVGYYGNEEATNATLVEDQWLRTGDIVYRDKSGYFWIVDRLKEMIKYKGFQVPPSELEGILLQHEDIIDAAVCSSYDDAQATELPVAYVALRPPLDVLRGSEKQKVLDDIKSWFDDQVIPYKKLRGGVFHMQNLPKNPSGKILRRELPAQVAARRQGKM